MLIFILLGVITKLLVVSADCDIESPKYKFADWTNISGTWYWLYHIPQKYNEYLDCPVSTLDLVSNNFGRVTLEVYDKRTQTRHSFVGTLSDWNTNEHPVIYYPEPSSDTNCAADGSCTVTPGYRSVWSGKYRIIAVDFKRYTIFEYCCKKLNTICYYVSFRTPNPDEETLNDVKKALKENELDFNQLVKWDTNHC